MSEPRAGESEIGVHGEVRNDLFNHYRIAPACDWGGCMKRATMRRFDAESGLWLPACTTCAFGPEDDVVLDVETP